MFGLKIQLNYHHNTHMFSHGDYLQISCRKFRSSVLLDIHLKLLEENLSCQYNGSFQSVLSSCTLIIKTTRGDEQISASGFVRHCTTTIQSQVSLLLLTMFFLQTECSQYCILAWIKFMFVPYLFVLQIV